MKIVFRLNFHTVPGQSLWLQLATVVEGKDVRIEKLLPLRWINDRQWETSLEVKGGGPLRLEYSYQFRQDDNAVELDEWNGPRIATPAGCSRSRRWRQERTTRSNSAWRRCRKAWCPA